MDVCESSGRGLGFDEAPLCLLEVEVSSDDARLTAVNPRAAAFYVHDSGGLLRQPLATLFEPHAASAHRRLIARALQDGEATLDTIHVDGQGDRLPVRIHARRVEHAVTPTLILAIEDIRGEIDRRTLLEAVDEDRRRIAHELHDTVAQSLAAMRMEIGLWKQMIATEPEAVAKEMDEVLAGLNEEIDRTRRAIFALRPAELDRLGFLASVRKLLQGMERQYGYSIQLSEPDPAVVLPTYLEQPLLRILQESLNNVGHHAQAHQVEVTLAWSCDALCMSIADDGIGFETATVEQRSRPGHYGLLQMHERVLSVGGKLLIDSAPGRGTRMQVRIARH